MPNYYPKEDGGYSVYDDDWNWVGEMPGRSEEPSITISPGEPSSTDKAYWLKREGIPPSLPPFKGGGGSGMSEEEEWAIKAKAIYEALGLTPPAPPSVEQLERDRYYIDLRKDILERARKKMGEIPGEEFEPRRVPMQRPYGETPYFDPLYSEPVLAMGYQEGGAVGEPEDIIIDRVPNDPAWEEDFYQAPNPDEAPYYPTQYVEPPGPSLWSRAVGGVGEAIGRMIPDMGDQPGVEPAGLPELLYQTFDPETYQRQMQESVETVRRDPFSQEAFTEYATGALLAAPFLPKGIRMAREAAGGRFLPGASAERGIMLSPAGGGGGLSGERGAMPSHIWESLKLVEKPQYAGPAEPGFPHGKPVKGAIQKDEAGNFFEYQGSHTKIDPETGQETTFAIVKPVENPLAPKSTKQWHELSPEAQWHFKQKYKINSDAFAEQQWNDSLKSMTPEQLLGPNPADQHFARWDMWETLPDDIKRQYPDPDKLTDFDWQKIKEYWEGDEPLSPLDLEHQKYVDESFKENLGDKIKKMSDEAQHIDDPEFEKKMDWDLEHPGEPYPPDIEAQYQQYLKDPNVIKPMSFEQFKVDQGYPREGSLAHMSPQEAIDHLKNTLEKNEAQFQHFADMRQAYIDAKPINAEAAELYEMEFSPDVILKYSELLKGDGWTKVGDHYVPPDYSKFKPNKAEADAFNEKLMDDWYKEKGLEKPPPEEPPLPPLPTPGTPEWEQYLNPFKEPENLPPRVPPMSPKDLSDAEYLDYLKRKHSLGDFPDMGPYEPGGPRWPQGGGYQEGGIVAPIEVWY